MNPTEAKSQTPGECLAVGRALLGFVAGLIAALAALVILAWLIGRIASDRWMWSQWLLWIPTPAALAAAALGLIAGAMATRNPGARWRLVKLFAAAAAMIGASFALVEHHLLRSAPADPRGLHLIHWNMAHKKHGQVDQHVDLVLAMGGDIMILSHAGAVAGHPRLQDRLDGRRTLFVYPFAIFTRFEVLELRPLAYSDGISLSLAVIDATQSLGRPLAMYLIDLPSSLSQPRAEIARQVRGMMEQAGAPPPDVVVGDFNMTRGSYASRLMFPGLRDACAEAGVGYNATFRRDWPLYHIDQMLLAPGVKALRYETIDPGFGRHRAQAAWLAARSGAGEAGRD